MYEKKTNKRMTQEDYLNEDKNATVKFALRVFVFVVVALFIFSVCFVVGRWNDFTKRLEKESSGSYVVSDQYDTIKKSDVLEFPVKVTFSDGENAILNLFVKYSIKEEDAERVYENYLSDEMVRKAVIVQVTNACKWCATDMALSKYLSSGKVEYCINTNQYLSDKLSGEGIYISQYTITSVEYDSDKMDKKRNEFIKRELEKAKEVQYREQSELNRHNDELLKKCGYKIDSRELDVKDDDSPETIALKKKITEHLKKIHENQSKDKKESEKQF